MSDSTERVPFRLHANLLQHLVQAQGARPTRAILELVQNAVDAGATKLDITIDPDGFRLQDDGRGFQDEREITEFFATFGTPQETQKQFGRFRVGRAQVFGWAATTYRSNTFQMTVDFEKDGQGFQLSRLDPPQPGCTITGTWNSLARRQLAGSPAFVSELLSVLSYPEITVTINGSVLPSVKDREWTIQTPEAYIQVDPVGDLRVYNQGVFVTTVPHAMFHLGGTVVTKLPLDLTMGRNELMHGCPVWTKVRQTLSQQAAKLHAEGGTVGTDEWRSYMLRKVIHDQGDLNAKVITLVPKRQVSLIDFANLLYQKKQLAVASRGKLNQVEHKASAIGMPILHFDSLDRARSALAINGGDEDVVFSLLDAITRRLKREPNIRSIPQIEVFMPEDFPKDSDKEYTILESNNLSEDENRFLDLLRYSVYQFAESAGVPYRMPKIGLMTDCEAFTDGQNIIVLNRKLVARLIRGTTSSLEFALIIAHEFAHEGDSRNAGHDEVFAHRYHALTLDIATPFNKLCLDVSKAATTIAAEYGYRRTKKILAGENRIYFWDDQRKRHADVPLVDLRSLAQQYRSNLIDEAALAEGVSRAFEENGWSEDRSGKALERQLANLPSTVALIPAMLPFMAMHAHKSFDRAPSTIRFLEASGDLIQFSHLVYTVREDQVTLNFQQAGTLSVKLSKGISGSFLQAPTHQQDEFFQWADTLAQRVCPWSERDRARDLIFIGMLAQRFVSPMISPDQHRLVHLREKAGPPARSVEVVLHQNVRSHHVAAHLAEHFPDWEVYPGHELLRDVFTEFERQAAKLTYTSPIAYWVQWSAAQ